jgi:hypothetical protein
MSLLERKLSNVLLYNAFDDLNTEKIHQVPINALAEISGYNSNDTATLKKALKNLKNVSVDWDILDDDGQEDWGSFALLAGVRFKGGICYYEYPSMLAEKLAEPEIYGSINIGIQKQFVSSYTLVIYEICSRAKGFLKSRNSAYTKWFTLEQFKKLLGVEDQEYYDEFKRISDKLIKPSINEINGSLKKYPGTDLFIEIEYKRVNRAVSDLRFKLKWNPQTQIPLEKDENDELRKLLLYDKLRERGFADKGALHVLLSNEPEYLEEKILLVDNAEKEGKIKSSVSGYLKRAIEDDYKPTIKKSEAKQKDEKAQVEAERLKQQEEAKAEKIRVLTKDISSDMRAEYIAGLSDEQRAEILKVLKSELPSIIKSSVKDLSHSAISAGVNNLVPNFESELQKRLSKRL